MIFFREAGVVPCLFHFMKTVKLYRHSDNGVQTLGELIVNEGNTELFRCVTLELPYKDNQRNISCIPVGVYPCRWTLSYRMNTMTYEVTQVPNRSGIRIHSANYFSQLLGCIALGTTLADINHDGEQDAINSRATVKKFSEVMQKTDFNLEVVNLFTPIV